MHRLARPISRFGGVVVIGVLLVAYPFFVKDPVWQNIAILSLIMATAAAGWNLIGGFAGQISFGHVVFFGIGAYTTGYLLVAYDLSPWIGIGVGCVFAAVVGYVIGFPVFRLRTHYFAIATLAIQQIAFVVVINQPALGAAAGLPLPPKPESIENLQFSVRDQTGYHLVALGGFAVVSVVMWKYVQGRAGFYTRAIRDDEQAASSVGVPVRKYKLYAMTLSAAATALAGGIYGMYVLFIDPHVVLGIALSIAIVVSTLLGGAGTLWGPLIGASALTVIQSSTRIQLGGTGSGVDFILYGALVMMLVLLEPRGIVGVADRIRTFLRVRRLRRSGGDGESGAVVAARQAADERKVVAE